MLNLEIIETPTAHKTGHLDKTELEIREALAITGEIIAYNNWDDLTFTHISARSSKNDGFFIPKFGILFSEMTAANLLKLDMNGNIVEGYEAIYNITGYNLHTPIYERRPDVNAIFHLHTKEILAVASMECGLLPISQHALHFYDKIGYHNYNSLFLDENEQAIKDLDQHNVLMLRNHGVVVCGKTIHEAFFHLYQLQRACEVQVVALACNTNLVFPPEEVCKKAVYDLLSFEDDIGIRDWKAAARRAKGL